MSKSETRQPELSPLSNGIYLAKLVRTRAGSKGEASELERLLAKATDVIFLAVSQLCQSLHTKGPVAWIITTLSFIQLLAFPLSHAPNLIWANEGTSSGFSAIFGYFILAPTSLRTDGAVKLSLVATVGCQAVFVLAFTSIIASQMYGSMKMSKSVQKVTRAILQIGSTVAVLPILNSGLQVYQCTGTWLGTSLKCFSSVHLLICVGVSMLLLLFSTIAVFCSLILFESNPFTSGVLGRAHGRADAVSLLAKILLVIVFVSDAGGKVGKASTALGVTLFIMFVYYHFLPCFDRRMNQALVGMSAVCVWASFCLALGIIRHNPHANVEAMLFVFASPFAFYTGYAVVDARLAYFQRQDANIMSPHMVELKVRLLLEPIRASMLKHIADYTSGHVTRFWVTDLSIASTLSAVDHLLSSALDCFSTSSYVHFLAGSYLYNYKFNTHLELLHMAAAEAKSPGLDVQCMIAMRRQYHREEQNRTGGAAMSVRARIRFEECKTENEVHGMKAREMQAEFWKEMSHHQPSMSRLDEIGNELADSSKKCESTFAMMLLLNPHSVSVMRRYAQFLLEVANDSLKGQKLLRDADDVEEMESRERLQEINSDFFLFSKGVELDPAHEDVSVITLGGSSQDLGIIRNANSVALKMFGVSRRELQGEHFATLLPKPMSTMYKHFLEEFMDSGEQNLCGSTRSVFGLHGSGFLFPMLISIKPVEDYFVLVAQLQTLTDQYIVFSTDSLTVIGASLESLLLFGVEANDVKEGNVDLSNFISHGELIDLYDAAMPNMVTSLNTTSTAMMDKKRIQMQRVSDAFLGDSHGDSAGKSSGEGSMAISARLQLVQMSCVTATPSGPARKAVHLKAGYTTKTSTSFSRRKSTAEKGLGQVPCLAVLLWTQEEVDDAEAMSSPDSCRREKHEHTVMEAQMSEASLTGMDTENAKIFADENGIFAESAPDVFESRPRVSIMSPSGAGSTSQQSSYDSDEAVPLKSALKGSKKARKSQESDSDDDMVAMNRDNKSQGSFASSAASTVHIFSRFHKALQRGEHVEETSLRNLRRLMMLGTVAVIGIVIAVWMTTNSVVNQEITSGYVTMSEGHRSIVVEQIVLYSYALLNLGQNPNLPYSLQGTQVTLRNALDNYQQYQQLVEVENPPETAEHKAHMFKTPLQEFYMRAESAYTTSNTLTDLAAVYMAAAQVIQNYTQAEYNPYDRYVWYIVNNGLTLSDAFLESVVLRYDEYNTVTVKTINFGKELSYITMCVVALEILALVLPVSLKMGNEKTKLFDLFMTIPKPLVALLASRSQQMFELTRLQFEQDNDEDNGEQDRELMERLHEGLQDIDYTAMDLSAPVTRVKQHDNKWTLTLCAKLSFPLFLSLGFLILYAQLTAANNTLIRAEQTGVLISTLTHVKMWSLLSDIAALIYTYSGAMALFQTDNIFLHYGQLSGYATQVASGVPAQGVIGSIHGNDDEVNLMFINGCIGQPDVAYCEQYQHGLFMRGFHGGLQHFIDEAQAYGYYLTYRWTIPGAVLLGEPEYSQVWNYTAIVDAGLSVESNYRYERITNQGDAFKRTGTALNIVFIIGLAFCFMLAILPVIRKLNVSMKRNRSLLLLLPEDLVTEVPEIQDEMLAYAKSSAT